MNDKQDTKHLGHIIYVRDELNNVSFTILMPLDSSSSLLSEIYIELVFRKKGF